MLRALQHHRTAHCGSSSTRLPTTRSCIAAAHQPRQQQRRQPSTLSSQQQQQRKHQTASSRRSHNKSQQRPQTSRLADSIKATQQLDELQRLVAEHTHNLTPHELVAVFLRAAKLRPLPHPWQQEQLLQPTWAALRNQLAACKAYEVVMVMWAAAKLGYRDPDVYSSTLDHLLVPTVLSSLQPRSLSNMVYALASAPAAVREQHVAPAVPAVLTVLLQQDKLAACNAQDVANVFYALGSLGRETLEPLLGCGTLEPLLGRETLEPLLGREALEPLLGAQPLQFLLHQLLGPLQRLAGSAEPQAFANTLWALARLGYPAPEQLLLQLSGQVLVRTDRAGAQDAASSIWALATLLPQQQQPQPQQQQQQSQEVAVAVSTELQDCVLQLLGIVAAPAFGRVNCHSLALALWGAAKLGVAVPHAQLQQLLSLCLQNSSFASAQDTANILYAFASWHVQQQSMPSAAADPQESLLQQKQADVLAAAAAAGAATAEPQAIANTLWAVAKLGLQVPVDTLKALVKPFTAHAQSGAASTQHLANTLWALATMQAGADAEQQLPQLYSQAQLQQQQQDVREPVPPRVVQVLLAAFMQQLQCSSSQEASNVLWAAAKMQYPVQSWDAQQLVEHVLMQSGSLLAAAGGTQQESVAGAAEHLEPQNAASILWSISVLHQLQKDRQQQGPGMPAQLAPSQQPALLRLPLDQLQLLLAAVLSDLHRSSDHELVSSLWAVARLQPCVLPSGLLSQQTLSGISARVGSMSLQAVAVLAYALGQLGAVEAIDLLVFLLQRGLQLTQQLTSSNNSSSSGHVAEDKRLYQVLPNLCWSAAVLGLTGQGQLLRALAAAASAHCWQQISPLGASQLYMLHMALQLEEQEAQQRQQRQQRQQQGAERRQQAVASTATTAAGLSGCLTPQQLAQCRAAWANCGSSAQEQGSTVAAASSLVATAAAAARGKLRSGQSRPGMLPASAPGFSLQLKVFEAAKCLQGLSRAPCYEAPTPDGLFSIDIQAETVSGVQLAIEVDGPSHVRLPDMALTGTTLFRNKQLAARGYVVVSVPYTGWNAAVAEQEQRQQQEQGEDGGQGRMVAEELLGVGYLQGLVDAAVQAAQRSGSSSHASSPRSVSAPSPPATAAAKVAAAVDTAEVHTPHRRGARQTAANSPADEEVGAAPEPDAAVGQRTSRRRRQASS